MTEREAHGASLEVTWPLDGTNVYATLVRPSGTGPFPAVVMVAGSGPTDRDWNTPLLPGSNGSARLLAEALAAKGVVSLRYDKRVAGAHAGENYPALMGKISFQSHVDELASAVRWLAGHDFVAPGRIFALTNSEGALHALNYQVHDPAVAFAGLVLTAPPGRVMSEVGRAQVVAQLSGLPNGAELIAAYDAAIARFQAGQEVVLDPAMPQGIQMLLQGLTAPANLPFARELWAADAAAWLAQVSAPVLVVIGQKDIQVDWQADGGRLQQAADGRADAAFVFPENANHVLKHEPQPRAELAPAEVAVSYNAPDAVLDPEALTVILAWLAAH
jgi:pimeloyl-ACP methyl ester carboxylesterase